MVSEEADEEAARSLSRIGLRYTEILHIHREFPRRYPSYNMSGQGVVERARRVFASTT